MASMSPKRVPNHQVVILPPNAGHEPRMYGGQAHKQHDMNDAARALLTFHDEMSARENAFREHATLKTEKKIKESDDERRGGMASVFVYANIYAVILIVILKMTRII